VNKAQIDFKDNIGLVHTQAKFGYKWAQGAGLSLDYEDMFQEASLAFVLAVEGYDPDSGLKFSTYYTKAAFSQFRKAIGVMSGVKNLNDTQRAEIERRKSENKRRAAAAEPPLDDCNYGLRPVMFSHIGSSDEEGSAFEESIDSEVMSPEQILEFKQLWQQATADLSPLAALIVEWLRDPPPELMRELHCQMLHADHLNEIGGRAYGLRNGLTVNNVGKFLQLVSDVKEEELLTVKAELDKLTRRIGGF